MFDLTQPLNERTPHFPGDPPFRREMLPGQAPWRVSRLSLSTHTGTHLDAPLHRIDDGAAVDALPPSRLTGHGMVVDATGMPANSAIPASVLDTVSGPLWLGWIALIHTGWDRYREDERYFQHPFLSPELSQRLVDTGCGLVAIDALSVDSTVDHGDAAHCILLGNGVLIAENLCGLDWLARDTRYVVACLPLLIRGADGAPARVLAWRPGAL